MPITLRLTTTTTVRMVIYQAVSWFCSLDKRMLRGVYSLAFIAKPLTVGLMLSQRLLPALPNCL